MLQRGWVKLAPDAAPPRPACLPDAAGIRAPSISNPASGAARSVMRATFCIRPGWVYSCDMHSPLPRQVTQVSTRQGVGKWFELRPIGNRAILGDAWGNCQHCVKMYEPGRRTTKDAERGSLSAFVRVCPRPISSTKGRRTIALVFRPSSIVIGL